MCQTFPTLMSDSKSHHSRPAGYAFPGPLPSGTQPPARAPLKSIWKRAYVCPRAEGSDPGVGLDGTPQNRELDLETAACRDRPRSCFFRPGDLQKIGYLNAVWPDLLGASLVPSPGLICPQPGSAASLGPSLVRRLAWFPARSDRFAISVVLWCSIGDDTSTPIELATFEYETGCAKMIWNGTELSTTRFSPKDPKVEGKSPVLAHFACGKVAEIKTIWWGMVSVWGEKPLQTSKPLFRVWKPKAKPKEERARKGKASKRSAVIAAMTTKMIQDWISQLFRAHPQTRYHGVPNFDCSV